MIYKHKYDTQRQMINRKCHIEVLNMVSLLLKWRQSGPLLTPMIEMQHTNANTIHKECAASLNLTSINPI